MFVLPWLTAMDTWLAVKSPHHTGGEDQNAHLPKGEPVGGSRTGSTKVAAGVTLTVALTILSAGCGWADADRGRNIDHDPPPGEETWDPDIQDPIDQG